MANKEYAAGLAFGILAALIIFIIFWKFKKKTMKGTFDERQELVKGKGYKYAFFTVLILMTFDLLAESYGVIDDLPLPRSLILFIMVLAGVMVYALYCIRNDSYFGVGNDTRTYRAMMWVILALNAFSGITGLREGVMVDGKIVFGPFLSLIFAASFAVLLIALYVRKRGSVSEESAEDDM